MIVPDASAFALLLGVGDDRSAEADRVLRADAAYVAAAEAHDATLVTADARIARAGVARCPIRTLV